MKPLNSFERSAIAGLLATVPMTVLMKTLHRQLPWYERYPLPPRQIAVTAARKVGLTPLDETSKQVLTALAHFGYGATIATPYAALTDRLPGPEPVKGAAYGLCVWAGSYLKLLPELGLLTPATMHPRRRNLLMIAAHLAWGASLGLLSETLQTHKKAPISKRKRSDYNDRDDCSDITEPHFRAGCR